MKPVVVPAVTRTRQYNTVDAEGNPVVKTGTETVTEHQLCPSCAGVSVGGTVVDITPSVALGLSLQKHAAKCDGTQTRTVKGKKVKEPCTVCARNLQIYRDLPIHAITVIMEDTRVHTGRMRIVTLALDSMLSRKNDNSKRARMDFLAAYPVLKNYEQRGGGL